jgi:hypothetical protein
MLHRAHLACDTGHLRHQGVQAAQHLRQRLLNRLHLLKHKLGLRPMASIP